MTLWFLARAAGFTALAAATVAVALGAWAPGLRGESRVVAQLAHRSAAVVTLALLALHAALLVADSHVDLTVPGALVPFTAGYRGFALGLGTLGAYCLLVASLVGALRGRLAASERAARWWRPVHALAYAAWPLSLAHGLLAGTDTGTWWSWSLYGGSLVVVATAVLARLSTEERHRRTPLAAGRQRVAALAGRS